MDSLRSLRAQLREEKKKREELEEELMEEKKKHEEREELKKKREEREEELTDALRSAGIGKLCSTPASLSAYTLHAARLLL